MDNIIGYAQKYLYPFAEKPFSEVDSLVLCQLSYLRYEHAGLEIPTRRLQFGSFAAEAHNQQLLINNPAKSMQRELMAAVAISPRFRWIEATRYVSQVDAAAEKQFSAVTYLLEDGSIYIAFRGTDSTIVGWKEDFNMAYLEATPSQQAGIAYLKSIAGLYDGPIRVGGHSKGGNTAVYAAAGCGEAVQDRILCVYSHDGPGFHAAFLERQGYLRIRDRIKKTVPEASIIGMLLQHQEPYTVVDSNEHGIFQHSALTWMIDGGAFSVKESISQKAQWTAKALNDWADTMDFEHRRLFIGLLFHVIQVTNATTLSDLAYATIRNAPAVVKAISGIDPETRQMFYSKLQELNAILERSKADARSADAPDAPIDDANAGKSDP